MFSWFVKFFTSPPRWQANLCPVWLVTRASILYFFGMSTVQEIEPAITRLEPRDIHAVADWLLEYRETLWDKKIAQDARAGKLDTLIKKAKAGHRAGKTTAFP
jgi:hypothetical protein